MNYTEQDKQSFRQKEKRELFCKVVNCYIMKSGADKDPLIDKILPIAKQIVDTAFQNYPDKNEEGEEKPL